ncbi:hypothetical protein ILYODFUR_003633 [Ilyodon furcidens]|uniref:Secreted protein n=1 Tax=Ilyodon furcidens TaxID=33524 RepID=A0ABV0STY5_9TELE
MDKAVMSWSSAQVCMVCWCVFPFSLSPAGCDRREQLHSCSPSGLIKDRVHKQLEPGRKRQIVYSPRVSGSDPEDPVLDHSCLMSRVQVLRWLRHLTVFPPPRASSSFPEPACLRKSPTVLSDLLPCASLPVHPPTSRTTIWGT